ncbi:MAG: hypothetical protein AAFZ63_28140 [Bacteroidota bacterium]
MKNKGKDVGQITAYNQEQGYIISRNFQVTVCALTSTLFTYLIGAQIAKHLFPNSVLAHVFFSGVMVVVGFLAIDWAFLNSLVGASTPHASGKYQKMMRNRAIMFFVCTLLMSIVSNFFVGETVKGDSHVADLQQELIDREERKDSLKQQAYTLLSDAGEVESQRLSDARKSAKGLLEKAITILPNGKPVSDHWQNDYAKAKNKPDHWFWVCSKCAPEYQRYRERIRSAEAEGKELIAEAGGYATNMQASLSPILSYNASSDSTLISLTANAFTLEGERNWRGLLIQFGLGAMALICGLMAFQNTTLLAEHRKIYGQQVAEDNVTSVLTILDLFRRIPEFFLDAVQNLFVRPFKHWKSTGWLQSYEFSVATHAIDRGAYTVDFTQHETATQDEDTHEGYTDTRTVATSDHKDSSACSDGKCTRVKYVTHIKENNEAVKYTMGTVNSRIRTYTDRLDKAKRKGAKAGDLKALEDNLTYWKGKLAEFYN